jgi:hypothetical protein
MNQTIGSRIVVHIMKGDRRVLEFYFDDDTDKNIMDFAKCHAKTCGKQLPKNCTVVRVKMCSKCGVPATEHHMMRYHDPLFADVRHLWD